MSCSLLFLSPDTWHLQGTSCQNKPSWRPWMFDYTLYYVSFFFNKHQNWPVHLYKFACKSSAANPSSGLWFEHIKPVSSSYITPFTLVWITPILLFFSSSSHIQPTLFLGTDVSCSEGGKMTEMRESQRRTRGKVRLNLITTLEKANMQLFSSNSA